MQSITRPSTCITESITPLALRSRKMPMISTAAISEPITGGMPKMTFMASPAPPMLPMLKAMPPSTMKAEIRWPTPGITRLATSWPRRLATVMIRQMLSWAPISISSETRMAKAKLARYFSVNSEVWVRKAGPMDDVAMMKMAPRSTLRWEGVARAACVGCIGYLLFLGVGAGRNAAVQRVPGKIVVVW